MKKLLILALVLGVAAFLYFRSPDKKEEPQRQPAAIPQHEATAGASLNSAFPKSNGDFKVTFTQEKDGFSQAEITRSGAKLATLSISDTAANPSARDKFKTATRKVAGHPFAANGSQGSAILAGRYQIQVRSLQPAFTAADRDAWLEKFNLSALPK